MGTGALAFDEFDTPDWLDEGSFFTAVDDSDSLGELAHHLGWGDRETLAEILEAHDIELGRDPDESDTDDSPEDADASESEADAQEAPHDDALEESADEDVASAIDESVDELDTMTDVDLELDEMDRQILRVLEEDARTPFKTIADEIDVSAPTASGRVNRMQEAGVIERFTVDVNPAIDTVEIPRSFLERLVTHATASRDDPGTPWFRKDEGALEAALDAVDGGDAR